MAHAWWRATNTWNFIADYDIIYVYKIQSRNYYQRSSVMSVLIDNSGTCCKYTCCADDCCSDGCNNGECSNSCCNDG